MRKDEVLDAKRLAVQVVPLQAILFISTGVGVVAGMAIVFVCAAIGTAFVPGGFFGWLAATLSLSVYLGQLVAAGIAAIILIPLGAVVASHLKLRSEARFIVEESGAQVLPNSNGAGSVVADMARRAGLPGPPRYGILENEFNALAVSAGPEDALILIGRPLQTLLESREIRAIIGHELGHVAMLDSRRKLLALGHQEFLVVFLGLAGLKKAFRAVFGLIGELAMAAYSREREYWADAVGAYLTSTDDMVSALRKLDDGPSAAPTKLEKNYAHLMLRSASSEWFSTHPSMEKRIAALLDGTYLRRLPVTTITVVEPAAPAPPPLPSYDGV